MADYNFEIERERRRTARWNSFLFLLACAIIVYIAFNISDFKNEIIHPKNESKYNYDLIKNPGSIRISDFRNNVVFESGDQSLNVQILNDLSGYFVLDNSGEVVAAFHGDGWYSLEIIDSRFLEDKSDFNQIEEEIESVE